MQSFQASQTPVPPPAGGLPQTPSLQRLGASPTDPHWPTAAGGSAPKPPKQPHPIANFWLRACLDVNSFLIFSLPEDVECPVCFSVLNGRSIFGFYSGWPLNSFCSSYNASVGVVSSQKFKCWYVTQRSSVKKERLVLLSSC